ncbi:MAG: acyl carrier protein [Clostridia bacterium]
MIQKEDETMVLDKVCEMIASQLQVDPAIVKRESRLVEDLKADSANVMVMILELESEFGIEVEDEVILKLKTVGDVADYIEKHQ